MLNEILGKINIYFTNFTKAVGNLFDGGLPSINSLKSLGNASSWEWWIAFFVVFVIFLSGFSYGKSRLFISLLVLYIAAIVEPLFPYFDKVARLIKIENDYIVHIIIFFVIYFIVFTLLNRSSLKSRFTLKEFAIGPIIFMAILKLGFLFSIIGSYLPAEIINNKLPLMGKYFTGNIARFWWAVIPILGTLFLKQKEE